MIRFYCFIAPAILVAGMLTPVNVSANDTSLVIRDAGVRRTFELALDEIATSREQQPRVTTRLSPKAGLRELKQEVMRRRQDTGEHVELVLYEVVNGRRTENRRLVTTGVYIKASPNLDIPVIARQAGAVSIRPTEASAFEWIAVASNSMAALELAGQLKNQPGVLAAEPLLARQQTKKLTPNDPLFTNQWHLLNTGQFFGTPGMDVRITNIWDSFRGTNITIAIIDDGLQTAHPDLAANVNTNIGWDFNFNDNDPNPGTGDDHGTACAGMAAAVGNNNLGVIGAAPEARLVGLRLISQATTDAQEADAMNWSNGVIHIKSNSWGPSDNGITLEGPGPLTAAALSNACILGRNGLGVLNFWAGGNGLASSDDSNLDGYANSIFTIAVGAVGNTGVQSYYSEPGANLVVCAPSSGYNLLGSTISTWTTDRTGPTGYSTNDYTGLFGGTSSATPLVAGIGALMLQANPLLGWRDVQEIMIRSATRNHPSDSGWRANEAGFWFNHKYGGGMINASGAVAMAQGWANLGPWTSITTSETNLNISIPDQDINGISQSFYITNAIRVEHAVVRVNITHPYRGDLRIELISPWNTTSLFTNARFSDGNEDFNNWIFMSVRHWGEFSPGIWNLRVADLGPQDTGHLLDAELILYGASGVAPTNEPPALFPIGNKVVVQNNYLEFAVTAVDPYDGDPITLTASNLPAGATFVATNGNGTFSWLDASPTGNFLVVFNAADKDGNDSEHVVISVVEMAVGTPPILNPIGNKSVIVDGTLQFIVSAVETEGDLLTLNASDLPDGAVFNPDGAIGTFIWSNASPVGVYTSSFHAADKDGVSSETIIIQVLAMTTGCFEYAGFTNNTPIDIRDETSANPYPSTISISGITTTVAKVTVTLHELSHTYPNDVDVLVVGPEGQAVVLFSGITTAEVNNVTLTFDKDALSNLPASNLLVSGTYLPTEYIDTDLGPPAPMKPYPHQLSDFEGISPNGTWSLYIWDWNSGDTGRVNLGWSVQFEFSILCDESESTPTNGYCGLVLSEYIEGSSDNKAIELYNGTPFAINLEAENYALEFYFNGSSSPGTVIELTGTIPGEGTYVIASSNANAFIVNLADQISGGNWFNGSEPVVLRAGTNVIDSIGQVGSTGPFAENITLVRKSSVTGGDTVADNPFDATGEWISFIQNTFSELGSHTMICTPNPDSDGDGIPDQWEFNYFGSITNANHASDWDQDGFIDLHEFLAGTDPTDDMSYLRVVDAIHQPEDGVIIYWNGITGKVYALSRATGLPDILFSTIASNIPGVEPLNVYTDAAPPEGAAHYRIELEP